MLEEEQLDRFVDEFWGDISQKKVVASEQVPLTKTKAAWEKEALRLIIQPRHDHKVGGRTWMAFLLMIIVCPILLYLSVRIFHGHNYLLSSLIIVFFAMVPFFLMFEGRKPHPRELIVIAVLAAIGVAGRGAFFMVPNIKCVTAIVIIAGVSLGGEAGFLVGVLTMFVSNMFMGQGPWTPWQMFTYGIIGFLAGILFKKGLLKAKRLSLCVFGFMCSIFIFGGIMNPAAILMTYGRITKESLIAFYISGLPVDLVHGVSTIIFMLLFARPLLEKLERVKTKYGLL
ncbi:ECF transporter S component [Eubacterium oxidoreducens]|uniref:Energy-coupling factor transport system substrate-specific component n=1 Tax=Eubacterium oxidoreducens TaxID=1732 RepID=A0A1G6AA72_EUBOX|nr:ECF transporter S component [Eubacterium oxidoreducens]SDB05289.1 energy-coupling factor transport system substrate-specific component [Eubacterium oxidoreducens]